MTLWLLTAAVFALLWIFWRALNFVLDLIGQGLSELEPWQAATDENHGEDAEAVRSGSY